MLSVVFATLSAKYTHVSLAPFCLMAGARAFASKAVVGEVVEATVNEEREAVCARILAKKPHLVCLSVYIWNRRESEELIRLLKEKDPALFIAVGGPEVSYAAEDFLRENEGADLVLRGEGERTVAALCDALSQKEGLQGVPCSVLRGKDGFLYGEEISPLSVPPSPITPAYLSAVSGRIAYLEASRGCPYRCAFCLSGQVGGVRYFPLERVLGELALLAKSGPKIVKLVDRTFNADRRRAREIWGFLIDEWGKKIPKESRFHFEIAGALLEEEDFLLLQKAPKGLFRFEIGIQSFHEKTLRAIDRVTDLCRLTENISRLTAMENIEIHIDLIAGLPHEDLALFAEGIDKAYALRADMIQLGFLKLLYGAKMRSEGALYPLQYSKEPPYEVESTPWLSSEDLRLLHRVENAFDRLYNSRRFVSSLAYLIDELKLRPYELFASVGRRIPEEGCSLNALYDLFFEVAALFPSVDPTILRDRLLYDRLTQNADSTLPKCLYKKDSYLSFVKKTIQEEARRNGRSTHIGVGVLYTEAKILSVSYEERDAWGDYKVALYPVTDFIKEKEKKR